MSAFYAFGAILLLLVAVVVGSAIRARTIETDDDEDPARRMEAALAALRQLEFDRETDKLPEEEYRRLHALYAREAVRARDAAGAAAGGGPAQGPADGSDAGRAAPSSRVEAAGSVPARCPSCGAAPALGARFCARCGADLEDA